MNDKMFVKPIDPILPTRENRVYLMIFAVFEIIVLGIGIGIGHFLL